MKSDLQKKTLIIITGPTASGKSALAVDVARRLHTHIISADSRQIYYDIPVVTAMPTSEERARAPHHLIDMLPLDAYYSASAFEQDALRLAERIWRYSDYAVVAGGSMMYVDALCNGIDQLPTIEPRLRESLSHMHIHKGNDWLLAKLRKLDEEYYNVVDRKNIKRVFHAVEICLQSGTTYTSLRTGKKTERPFRIVKLYLDMPRELLFDRINRRVERMMKQGLLEEARRVYELRTLNSLNTVGLKELFKYFDGEWDIDTAIARIQKNTRVYAKKQMTWYAKDNHIIRVNALSPTLPEEVLNIINGK